MRGIQHCLCIVRLWCLAVCLVELLSDFLDEGRDKKLYKPQASPRTNFLFTTTKPPTVQIYSYYSPNTSTVLKITTATIMHSIKVIFTLLAATAVMAAPGPDTMKRADCPNGWQQCGVCGDNSLDSCMNISNIFPNSIAMATRALWGLAISEFLFNLNFEPFRILTDVCFSDCSVGKVRSPYLFPDPFPPLISLKTVGITSQLI